MKRDEKMIVGLMGCSHALSHGYLLIFPTVLPLLGREFSMGYLGLGVIGNIMVLAYGLGALPGGMLYNRFGPKRLYLLCFLGSAGASLLVAVSPHFVLFTAGVALLGAMGSIYHPLATSLITQRVEEYGRGLGIHGAAGNAGMAAAPFLAGLMASSWGWRQAYVWFAATGVALSICSLFIDMSLRKGNTQKPPSIGKPKDKKEGLLVFFSLPIVLVYVVNMFNAFCYRGTITFLPTYMARRTSFQILSFDSVAIGGMLSGIVLLMGIVGQYIGGTLGQKPNLERNLLLVCALAFPFMLSMSFTVDVLLLMVAVIYYFSNFCTQPMSNVLLAHYTTPEMRGTAFGIFFFAASGIGSFAASFAGYVAQAFGLPWVFSGLSVIVVLQILCSFCLLKVKKRPLV
jgi:MFS family permease